MDVDSAELRWPPSKHCKDTPLYVLSYYIKKIKAICPEIGAFNLEVQGQACSPSVPDNYKCELK